MNAMNISPGSVTIRFLAGPLAGSTLQVSKPLITIGREPTNDIVISDPSVSRQHARLVNNGGLWSIEKIAPQNVVTVNQQNVQQAVISDRDTIGLGAGTTFLFLLSSSQSYGDQRPVAPFSVQPSPLQQTPSTPQFSGQQQQSFTEPYAQQLSTATQRAPVDEYVPGSTADSHGTIGSPTLEISSNVHADKQSVPLTKQVINIGRDPSNDIVINELVVSAFHAQIIREDAQLVFIHPHPARDKTLNGLLYQGRHIQGNEAFRKPLTRGDIFRIGDEHGTLVTLTYNDGSGAVQDIIPEVRPIPLGAPVITIGRLPENKVVLSHPQVSGRHARLEQVQGGYRIIDVGSTNHIYVNTQRVTNQLLRPGDEIRIGPYKFTYTGTQLTQQDESKGVRIDALHLQKVGTKHTILINDISITIPQRKFVALVGGSGAGKSMLMDALNGLRPAQKGLVLYNGQDYYRHLAVFSTQLGYVPQDDIIHRDLTVERALYYTAKMRLPEDFTEAQIKQRIDEVLEDVEMKHRRSLLVSKLSGGQRKRVSIALELLSNPSLFFLDEPTSGLDPGLDRKMMFLLRRLADKGHTIVLVTHATNNINVCDYICFLAQGGRMTYFGPPNEAKAYFGKTDFAEIYSTLEPTEANPNIPDEAENRFKASPDYQQYVVGPLNQGPAGRTDANQHTVAVKPPKRGNPWKQFSLLSSRYRAILKNDKANLAILLLQAPLIGLLLLFFIRAVGPDGFNPNNVLQCPTTASVITNTGPDIPTSSNPIVSTSCQQLKNFLTTDPRGIAYANQRGGTNQALQDFIVPGPGYAETVLFIMAFSAIFFGCINAAREIVKEAPIYRRERAVNLGILPYLFSKIVVLALLCLVQSAILVLCVSIPDPITTSIFLPPVIEVYITIALTSLAGLMMGLMVSALVPNTDRAMSIVPLLLIPQIIFSGTIFPLNSWFLQLLSALFPIRWAMAALGSSIGLHSDKLNKDTIFGNSPTFHGTLLSTYSQAEAIQYLLLMWLALTIMIIVFGVATAYFLKRKDIRK
jgi:ABC-type multidrug transport system ATPase subunit/pSer/pThr/pTyr-binding forkhead associated (FHA) protein